MTLGRKGVCKNYINNIYFKMHLTFSSERYTEQVTPVLVFAQRQLQEKKQLCESDNAQSCLEEFITNTGDKVKYFR